MSPTGARAHWASERRERADRDVVDLPTAEAKSSTREKRELSNKEKNMIIGQKIKLKLVDKEAEAKMEK